jgi:hypothetical protein
MIANNPSFITDKFFSHYNINDLNEDDLLLSSSTDIYNIRPDLSNINNESMLFNENESQDAKKKPIFKTDYVKKREEEKSKKKAKIKYILL